MSLSVEALRLDRSLFNATLGYRITVRNPDGRALNGVVVEADLVSARQDLPTEKQLASPHSPLARQHSSERLGPGQSQRFEGQVRLPLAEASAIRQGNIGLLVPLLQQSAPMPRDRTLWSPRWSSVRRRARHRGRSLSV